MEREFSERFALTLGSGSKYIIGTTRYDNECFTPTQGQSLASLRLQHAEYAFTHV